MKTTSSSSPFRERIDYISTALAYCWLIWISKVRHAVQSGVFHIMRLFVFIFLPQKYLEKFDEKHMDALETQEILFGDLEHGHDISTAHQLVYMTFVNYMTLPLAIVAGIICSMFGLDVVLFWEGGVIPVAILFTWGVLAFIGLRILTKAIAYPNIYLSYFKEFKKQDREWLRKWKRYTILLFVGGLLSAAMGICFVFYSFMHT